MEKELNFLGTTLENPERPFVAILGGKKVSDKIGVIDSLLEKVDTLMIGEEWLIHSLNQWDTMLEILFAN